MDNRQKAVLVTGASQGTGLTVADRFAREGWNVVILSRSAESAEAAAASLAAKYPTITARGYESIIGDEDNVKAIFADLDKQGIFVQTVVFNAANFGMGQESLTVDVKDFMGVFETNVGWNFMVARQAALRMKEQGIGSLVFITSNTAYRSVRDRCAYSASKSAIMGMSRSLAYDWGRYGIRSNCVVPGMIKTERWQENRNGIQDSILNCTPIGDIAEFEDIANAAWYFGSEQSRNTTGAELIVDGGNSIQLIPDYDRWQNRNQ